MESKNDFTVERLVRALDSAVLTGDVGTADEIAGILFQLQGGTAKDTVMPEQFPAIMGGQQMKSKNIKKIVTIAAAAVLITALGITALATHFFGLRDMVMKDSSGSSISNPYGAPPVSDSAVTQQEITTAPSPQELIALQGYPDSSEYKATAEWIAFLSGYDTDHSILNSVGNGPNAYTGKYPTYLVYSEEMADKLEEIVSKYGLKKHTSILIAETPEQLFTAAGVGSILNNNGGAGVNRMLGGYIYNDGTFHYDGEALLETGTVIEYQFGNYVKGTFSDTYLNIGDASDYLEWQYTSKSGVRVSLALSQSKALVIADLPRSFAAVNVLIGTDGITKADLEKFADMFDFTKLQ